MTLRGWLDSPFNSSSGFQPFSYKVTNITTTAIAIVAVQSQPMAHSGRGKVNRPMIRFCIAMIMMTTISGTATTPFSTADQNNALIGSRSMKLMNTPSNDPTTIVP